MVHDAEAQIAVYLGSADPPVRIIGLETQAPPPQLNQSVEALIAEARASAARSRRASRQLPREWAKLTQARGAFFPVVGLSAGYGENLWNFSFQLPRTVQTGQPQYSALLTLRWETIHRFQNASMSAVGPRTIARLRAPSLGRRKLVP